MKETTKIHPAGNGPYLVEHCDTLRGMDGKSYESSGKIALCRCGGSKNKPYCDGTHAKNGFSDGKAEDRVADKREDYVGDGITIHDNRGICAHAGRCTDGLKSVFRLGQEPWIEPRGDARDKIIDTIQQCPSGALSYTTDDGQTPGQEPDPMILIVPNGPYAIRGGADLENSEWGEGASKEHFTLCRCGKSQNKPFCSGAHWYHHFDEHAPPPES